MTNLTVLTQRELCLRDLAEASLPEGEHQRLLIREMLDLELFRKLAELTLTRDALQAKFVLTEKGTLKLEVDECLRMQLTKRLSLILQAINSCSLNRVADTWQAKHERQAILLRIADEREYLDGIEAVYQALLNRQTVTALENQAAMRPGLTASNHDAQAIADTQQKMREDLARRRTILQVCAFVTQTNFLGAMAKHRDDLRVLMADKSLLLHELLRQAPLFLREPAKLPLSSLEDVVALFDQPQTAPFFLPYAVILYHLEAYIGNFFDKTVPPKTDTVDAAFIPVSIQRAVESVFQLDRLLNSYGQDQEAIVSHVLCLLDSDLVRAQALLAALVTKDQFSAALFVVNHPAALSNAHAENGLDQFVLNGLKVFTTLGKVNEAIDFLSAAEPRLQADSETYETALAQLVEHVVRLDKAQIQSSFLARNFTRRQEAVISAYLQCARPTMQVIREFWNRRAVKAVGLAMQLDWEDHAESAQVKAIRKQAVRLFTGIGTSVSEDGIFSSE